MNPSLYDLLDVDASATDNEVRAAWKAAIADLGPTDRRFRAYNQAAEVLLDPEKRAAYDAELSEPSRPDEVRAASGEEVEQAPSGASLLATDDGRVETQSASEPESSEDAGELRGGPAPWVVATVAAVALAVLAVTIWMWLDRYPQEEDEAWVDGAIDAAADAAPKALAYDYRTLDDDIAAAQSLMTEEQRARHNELMADLRGDVVAQQAVVESEVLGSGLVRGNEGQADVLVFVNQHTTKAPEGGGQPQEVLIPLWVRFQMVNDDGEWLLDRMVNEGLVASSGDDAPVPSPSPSATASTPSAPATSPSGP